jgi:hypothetical protein
MEITKTIIATVLATALLAGGCVKDPQDIPGTSETDPVFGFAGSFGQQDFMVQAGVDRWTMVPVTSDLDGNTVYAGVFSEDGCLEACSPAIRFDFYQAVPGTGSPAGYFNMTIRPGQKDYVHADLPADSFLVNFSTHPGLFMSGYSYWENQNAPPLAFTPAYGQAVGAQSALEVCFESFQFTGCQYSQCVYFQPATGTPCLAYIEAAWLDTGFVKLTVRPRGNGPFTYEWYHGQTTPSILVPIQTDMVDVLAGVTVRDASGNSSRINQLVRIQDALIDPCFFPINISTEAIPREYAETYANRTAIRWTDESGLEWSTATVEQPSDAYFEILSVTPYADSPAGDPAYKVEIAMRALLQHPATGETRWLQTDRSTIALSYPE